MIKYYQKDCLIRIEGDGGNLISAKIIKISNNLQAVQLAYHGWFEVEMVHVIDILHGD